MAEKCECGHPKSHHYFDTDVRTGPWKCLTFIDPKCSCGVYREVPEKKEVAMTDAELDAMLATHKVAVSTSTSAKIEHGHWRQLVETFAYVPTLVAEVRRLNEEMRALHRQRVDDAVSVGALRGECGVLRAENERLSKYVDELEQGIERTREGR